VSRPRRTEKMKRLVLAITLASLAALPHAGAAASRRTRACPALAISCTELIRPGVPATFTLTVKDAPGNAKLTYNWVISAGTISSGQGTSSINVDTTGVAFALGGVTATVDVAGLPEGCAGSASCVTTVNGIGDPRKVDEYGKLRWGDERARLDNFGIEVRNDPEAVGYIVGYGGRRSHHGEAASRIERAKRYLATVRDIDASRLVTIDGGYREELTVELWALPKDVTPPAPSPTVDPTEVEFIKPMSKRRARRR
jgi:hypothetical protein